MLFAQGCFIELAFRHPQCGWFYRRNVTGIRKKNRGFNFRRAKKSFRNVRFGFTLPAKDRPRIGQGIQTIALDMSL